MTTLQETTSTTLLVDFLLQPDSYHDQTDQVQLIETHISWVFLTDHHAYKLKKPVRFEFLDFTSPEARRTACQEEVRLNRRLAPDVYLGVVPITTGTDGHLQFGGRGAPVDWIVKMRRLPADHSLEHRIRNRRLSDIDVKRIANTIATQYSQLNRVDTTPELYRKGIESRVEANFRDLGDDLEETSLVLARRVHSAQLRFLRLASHLLDERVCDGRIVEGHGDLRPDHIYLEAKPIVIDCVEFSKELRILDVADELCFFAMECECLGATYVGQQVFEAYSCKCNDHPSQLLLDFYSSYRASVRAKVAQLRSTQLKGLDKQSTQDRALRYLGLADQFASHIGKPLLVVVRGLMGTGKSTLATELANQLGAQLLSTDSLRRELFPDISRTAGYGEGNYAESDRRSVYEVMMDRATKLLKEGMSVVLDGTFLTADPRAKAAELANRFDAMFLMVRCDCPDEEAMRRVSVRRTRGDLQSDARPDLLPMQRNEEQPDSSSLKRLTMDTTQLICQQVDAVYARLSEELNW